MTALVNSNGANWDMRQSNLRMAQGYAPPVNRDGVQVGNIRVSGQILKLLIPIFR